LKLAVVEEKLNPDSVTVFVFVPAGIVAGTMNDNALSALFASSALTA
jgi:hypothetical protein